MSLASTFRASRCLSKGEKLLRQEEDTSEDLANLLEELA